MSDKQLKKVNERLNMEQQYARLTALPPSKKAKVAGFVSSIAVNVARQQITNLANEAATKKVNEMMKNFGKVKIPPPPNRFPSGPPLTPRLG